ncbi:hypothetical protein Bca4012_003322 [Brassica carinata]
MDSVSLHPLSDSIQLPVIDFSDQCLTPGTSKWDKVKTDVRKALEDYGCFEAFFDKVSVELDKSVFEAMEELFDLPTQTKERNVSSKPYHGYLSQNIYESFGIDDANLVEKVNEFTQQLWPDHGNKRISETMHGISGKLAELDVMVRRMIMESFGIEKYIDEHLDSTNYLFRMMKYTPPPPLEEKKLGLPSHTDKNIMTILHQYQVEGLEIQNKDKKWFKVKPSHQYSFIVMVGDSMCAFLNGRLASTYHRVLVTAKKTRYSTALFSTPKTGVILDSPEELIDEEHPRVFKPFEFNDYRDFYNTEAGILSNDLPLALIEKREEKKLAQKQKQDWDEIPVRAISEILEATDVSLVDPNKESSSEGFSTPFSKRKEADADLLDMTSTSKKPCTQKIKMENTKSEE